MQPDTIPPQSTPTSQPDNTQVQPVVIQPIETTVAPITDPQIQSPDSTSNTINNDSSNNSQDSVILSDSAMWTNNGVISKTPVVVNLYRTHLSINNSSSSDSSNIDDIPINQVKISKYYGPYSAGAFTIKTTSKTYAMRFSGLTMSDIILGSLIFFSFVKSPVKEKISLWISKVQELQQ